MKNNNNENSLIKVNENSIFYKIKKFFRNLFGKKESNITPIENQVLKTQELVDNKKDSFRDTITNVENDETRLLKLQKQFENGEITEEELTQKQIDDLEKLYNTQIEELQKSNELRKEKIKNSPYGSQFFEKIKAIETDETRLLKLQKSYESGEVKEEDLTDEQVDKLLELYQDQIDGLRMSNERRKKKLLEYRENMKKAI